MLLYAAGETIDETKVHIPDNLKPPELNLKHLCRETIRKQLIQLSPVNLFHRVPKLGLPPLLARYVLYSVSLDAAADYVDVDANPASQQ